MTMTATTAPTVRSRVRLLVEVAIVLALAELVPMGVVRGAAALGTPLPDMPFLRHTYIFFLFIMALFVWLRLRGERPATFGLIAPKNWLVTIGRGALIFVIIMIFDIAIKPMIDPWLASSTGTSANLAQQFFGAVEGNFPMLLYLIAMGWLFGGFGEEMLYRGYVMTRIAQVLGEGRAAWIVAIVLQAIPFALGHWYLGPVGMVGVFFAALMTGTASVIWGRNLWPAIIAHGLQDTFGFTMLYLGMAHAG